jgi:hypothetical protein
MGAFVCCGSDPAVTSVKQQAYAQMQAGLEGYYTAAKGTVAVIASAAPVVVQPDTLPLILSGWNNVAVRKYVDDQSGNSSSGLQYGGSFLFGVGSGYFTEGVSLPKALLISGGMSLADSASLDRSVSF